MRPYWAISSNWAGKLETPLLNFALFQLDQGAHGFLDQDNLTVESTTRPVNLVKVDIVGFRFLKSDRKPQSLGHIADDWQKL